MLHRCDIKFQRSPLCQAWPICGPFRGFFFLARSERRAWNVDDVCVTALLQASQRRKCAAVREPNRWHTVGSGEGPLINAATLLSPEVFPSQWRCLNEPKGARGVAFSWRVCLRSLTLVLRMHSLTHRRRTRGKRRRGIPPAEVGLFLVVYAKCTGPRR